VRYRQSNKLVTTISRVACSRSLLVSVLVAVFGFGTGSSRAEVIDIYGSYTADYSNNVLLTPTMPVADLAHVATVGMHYQQTGKQLEARIVANAQYRHYTNGTLEDQLIPSLNASQIWYLTPGRFHWFIQDRLSQILKDPLGAPTLQNQQAFNIFTTGPTFLTRLGPVDSLELEGRYGNTFYSQTFDDSDRYSGRVLWKHNFSPITDLSTSLKTTKVNFVHGAFENYDVYEPVFGITTRRRNTTIGVDVGGTALNRETSDDRYRPLLRLRIDSTPTPTIWIAFTYERRFTDLTQEVVKLPLSQYTNIQTGNIYYGIGGDTIYEQTWAPTKLRLHFYTRDRDYIDATPDEFVYGGVVDLTRDFSARFNGGIYGRWARTHFASVTEPDITSYGLGLRTDYRLRNDLKWTTELRWNKRDSAKLSRTYDEFAALISIIYGRPPPNQQQ
jgi:hypothetical protein